MTEVIGIIPQGLGAVHNHGKAFITSGGERMTTVAVLMNYSNACRT